MDKPPRQQNPGIVNPEIAKANHKAKVEFQKKLRTEGWVRTHDGEDFCSDCYPKYLKKIGGDSEGDKPTANFVDQNSNMFKGGGEYWVMCESCQKTLSVPIL